MSSALELLASFHFSFDDGKCCPISPSPMAPKIPSVIETDKGDEIAIRNKLFLSHTYDHRIIDGALGGKFAQKIGVKMRKIYKIDCSSTVKL